MAHEVKFTIPTRDLGRADITFDVNNSGTKLGTLKISKGSLVWVPRDHSYGRKLNWATFADLMEERGVRE